MPSADYVRELLIRATEAATMAEDALRAAWDQTAAADLQDALRHATQRLAALDHNIDRLRELNHFTPASDPYAQTR